jgi:hypothetical protein
MENEDLLLCLQEAATVPYPVPAESSPCLPSLFI